MNQETKQEGFGPSPVFGPPVFSFFGLDEALALWEKERSGGVEVLHAGYFVEFLKKLDREQIEKDVAKHKAECRIFAERFCDCGGDE
jgi:hypothetical protein